MNFIFYFHNMYTSSTQAALTAAIPFCTASLGVLTVSALQSDQCDSLTVYRCESFTVW